MLTVELYAGIRRAVMVDGLSRREAASFDAVLRQSDDVRGPPRGRKKGVWRRRKKRSIIARPWETPNRGKFIMQTYPEPEGSSLLPSSADHFDISVRGPILAPNGQRAIWAGGKHAQDTVRIRFAICSGVEQPR